MTHPTYVVGIDGSPASRTALTMALAEARAHDGRIHAVTCWRHDTHEITDSGLPPADSYENASAIQRSVLFNQADEAGELEKVVREITEGDPGPALIAASRKASGLFIGATSAGTFSRLAHHSVSDHCLRHSHVPVTVVPYVPQIIESLDEAGVADFRGAIDRIEMTARN